MSTDKELVDLFKGLDTPAVSDAMDKLGIPGQCLGIKPLEHYKETVVGPAFTVKYVPCGQPAGTVGDFIDDVSLLSWNTKKEMDNRTDFTYFITKNVT